MESEEPTTNGVFRALRPAVLRDEGSAGSGSEAGRHFGDRPPSAVPI